MNVPGMPVNPRICPILTIASAFISVAMHQKALIVGQSVQAAPGICVEGQCALWTGRQCAIRALGVQAEDAAQHPLPGEQPS